MDSTQNPSSPSTISSHVHEEQQVMMTAEEIEAMKKSIFKNAMKRRWDDVLTEYKKPIIQELKITRSGDTILHLAVLDWDLGIVGELVKLISDDNLSKILKLKNNRGDTVLHLAAANGFVEMCECIIGSDSSLIGERNDDSETPLFLAASLGKKEAFLFLHSRCGSNCDGTDGLPYWRRLDGETVLHCAIHGEYFDLAYQIIQIYGDDLVNCNNEKGLSPLHILASKPNVFKSGSSLGRFGLLIYHYMLVDNPEDPTNYHCSDANGAKNFDEENGSKLLPPPPNNMYSRTISFISFYFFKLAMKTLFGISALLHFSSRLYKIKYKKENIEATRFMEELIKRASGREYDTYADDLQTSIPPPNAAADPPQQTKAKKREEKIESPILIAAKMGVIEMVDKLLDKFPLAIQDMNAEKKNIVLLAVENRQSHVYNLLLDRIDMLNLNVFEQLDNKGNSVLHLAATLGESRPWLIPGAALQMQSEIRWYKFVKYSASIRVIQTPNFSARYNNEGKTAEQVFSETHKDLVKEGSQWLTNTSQSCSVVAALIATVAFATAATVPGGLDSITGAPTFATKPAFKAFAISSLIALCFSVTSVIMFLAILTSVHEEKSFANDLPNKLIVALFSLVISIASMLVSFCVSQVFVFKNNLIYAAYPFYILTSLPVAFFILIQFPLIDMIKSARSDMPQRSYKLKAGPP